MTRCGRADSMLGPGFYLAAAARRACLAALLGFVCAASGQPLQPAQGAVVLTLTGKLARADPAGEARFDMAMLAALPQHSFTTRTPWYPQPRKFTGVRLRDLLAAVGASGTDVRAIALNDYRADIPAEDIARHDVTIAYLLDDQPMRVRDKGPLVVIYPFDSRREVRTAVHYSRAVWQLHRLEVK